MAKLNIQKQGFPSSVSDAYSNLLGVKSDNQYVNISLSLLDEIEDQPFPINEDKVDQIADSIEAVGVIEPLIVVKNGGRYYILSGRHRFRACRQLGKEEVPCFIREMNITDPEARYILLATNTDRNNEYTPTVYARAYSEQLELLKKLGKKSTVSAIAEQNGMSRKQIYRYIRLTNLIPDIQKWVDNNVISIEAAVELSFLSENKQLAVVEHIKGVNDSDISKYLKVYATKNIHIMSDELSDEEFTKNIDTIVLGKYGSGNQEKSEKNAKISKSTHEATVKVDDEHKCITGVSQYGFCGAASFCEEPYECCAACPEDCNARCGWLSSEKEEISDNSESDVKIPIKVPGLQTDSEELALPEESEEEEAEETFVESTEWSNAIKGYLILAARNADFSREQIKDLIDGLLCAMKEHDKTEAENTYLYW